MRRIVLSVCLMLHFLSASLQPISNGIYFSKDMNECLYKDDSIMIYRFIISGNSLSYYGISKGTYNFIADTNYFINGKKFYESSTTIHFENRKDNKISFVLQDKFQDTLDYYFLKICDNEYNNCCFFMGDEKGIVLLRKKDFKKFLNKEVVLNLEGAIANLSDKKIILKEGVDYIIEAKESIFYRCESSSVACPYDFAIIKSSEFFIKDIGNNEIEVSIVNENSTSNEKRIKRLKKVDMNITADTFLTNLLNPYYNKFKYY